MPHLCLPSSCSASLISLLNYSVAFHQLTKQGHLGAMPMTHYPPSYTSSPLNVIQTFCPLGYTWPLLSWGSHHVWGLCLELDNCPSCSPWSDPPRMNRSRSMIWLQILQSVSITRIKSEQPDLLMHVLSHSKSDPCQLVRPLLYKCVSQFNCDIIDT